MTGAGGQSLFINEDFPFSRNTARRKVHDYSIVLSEFTELKSGYPFMFGFGNDTFRCCGNAGDLMFVKQLYSLIGEGQFAHKMNGQFLVWITGQNVCH